QLSKELSKWASGVDSDWTGESKSGINGSTCRARDPHIGFEPTPKLWASKFGHERIRTRSKAGMSGRRPTCESRFKTSRYTAWREDLSAPLLNWAEALFMRIGRAPRRPVPGKTAIKHQETAKTRVWSCSVIAILQRHQS